MWYDLADCNGTALTINSPSIALDCNSHSIDGNFIGKGIHLLDADYSTVKNCEVREFYYGIYSQSGTGTLIMDNNSFSTSSYGIHSNEGPGEISGNNVFDSNGCGIYLSGSDQNVFSNTTQNTLKSGICGYSNRGIVSGNTSINSSGRGIGVNGNYLTISGNKVTGNANFSGIEYRNGWQANIFSNLVQGSPQAGIYLHNTDKSNVFDNNVSGNGTGILLSYSEDNNLTGNFSFENGYGIRVLNDSGGTAARKNRVAFNSLYGIYSSGSGYLFWDNNFTGNAVNAYEENGLNDWNYGVYGNYWDDFSLNPGYPAQYEIPGGGSGVDFHPLAQVYCGQRLTENATIFNSLEDCPENGLIIDANNITIDCVWRTISGNGSGYYKGIYLNRREGVTLRNCNVTGFHDGIGLDYGSGNFVQGNNVYGNSNGIFLWESALNEISGNSCSNNSGSGIFLWESSENTLKENIAESNETGIEFHSSSNYNTVSDNNALGNLNEGFLLHSVSGNNLTGNLSLDSSRGFRLNYGSGNALFQNISLGNSLEGLLLYSSSGNQLLENDFLSNSFYGAYLSSSSGNLFSDNDFTGNGVTAFEDSYSNENDWNSGAIGNFWPDFSFNPGYPTGYEVHGPGNGIDFAPLDYAVRCGGSLTRNTVLYKDLFCAEGNGLVLDANGIFLDCGGRLIDGLGAGSTGILLDHRSGTTVRNCDVNGFARGIDLDAGTGNSFLSNNVSSGSNSGISLGLFSYNNRVEDNNVSNFGYYCISLQFADDNNVSGNNVTECNSGLYLYYSSGNLLTGNNAYGNFYRGAYLWYSPLNFLWGNNFYSNPTNAYEGSFSGEGLNGNKWDNGVQGNFWDDFSLNSLFPFACEIPGTGDGVDGFPDGVCLDFDGDSYSSFLNPNCPFNPSLDCDDSNPRVNPGQNEVCGNGLDDNCNGLVNEGCPSEPLKSPPKTRVQ